MNAISGASAATATPAAAQPAPPDPALDDRAVVFRGDGEPKTPAGMIARLAELDAQSALDPDNYSLGGSVEALERHFADLLGTEAAIFMPTGTLANHLAIRRHCGIRPRAIVQEQSHLYHDSGDTVTRLSSINLVPLAPGRPHFTAEELEDTLSASVSGRVINEVGAVMIESPVRRQSGQVVPIDLMRQITPDVPRARHTHPPGRRAPVHDVGSHRHTRRRLRRHVRHHLRVPVQVLRRPLRRDTVRQRGLRGRPLPRAPSLRRRPARLLLRRRARHRRLGRDSSGASATQWTRRACFSSG